MSKFKMSSDKIKFYFLSFKFITNFSTHIPKQLLKYDGRVKL